MFHALFVDLAPARATAGLDVRLRPALAGEHNLDLAKVAREVEDNTVDDRRGAAGRVTCHNEKQSASALRLGVESMGRVPTSPGDDERECLGSGERQCACNIVRRGWVEDNPGRLLGVFEVTVDGRVVVGLPDRDGDRGEKGVKALPAG